MKSTLKVIADRNFGNSPKIKIVIPIQALEEMNDPSADVDEKDILLRDFIQEKRSSRSSTWFRLSARFTHPVESPTHQIFTIGAIDPDNLFMELKGAILDFLPNQDNEDLTVKYPEVFRFFNTLEATVGITQKKGSITMRECLPSEYESLESKHSETIRDEFKSLAQPLIDWIKLKQNPHCSIIIDSNSAELLEGSIAFSV